MFTQVQSFMNHNTNVKICIFLRMKGILPTMYLLKFNLTNAFNFCLKMTRFEEHFEFFLEKRNGEVRKVARLGNSRSLAKNCIDFSEKGFVLKLYD